MELRNIASSVDVLKISDSFSPLTEFGHRIQQSVMTLITLVDGQVNPIGTGFTIAPDGLMMTAVHVIQEALKGVAIKRNGDGTVEHVLEFYALYITSKTHGENNEHTPGGLLPIQRVWYSPELDIGFCAVTSPIIDGEALKYPIFKLSPGLPKVGENILGFGYHSMKGTNVGKGKDGKVMIEYSQDTAFTRGNIVEVFPIKRDHAMLPFPCFHTNARFEPGMRGGPVINERGNVCGVICSSFPSVEDNPEYISYGSLIWPALGTSIEAAISQGALPEMLLVYDLIERGFVLTDETISNVKVDLKPNGERTVSLLSSVITTHST